MVYDIIWYSIIHYIHFFISHTRPNIEDIKYKAKLLYLKIVKVEKRVDIDQKGLWGRGK